MTLLEPGLVDANVLVYAMNADAPQHQSSRALIDSARDFSVTLYVTSQVLCEFYSVITSPRRVAAPSSSIEGLSIISALLRLPGMHVLPVPVRAVEGWLSLLRHQPVTGGEVFDLQLAATMLANGVQRIYTFNTDDFEVFDQLVVVLR